MHFAQVTSNYTILNLILQNSEIEQRQNMDNTRHIVILQNRKSHKCIKIIFGILCVFFS